MKKAILTCFIILMSGVLQAIASYPTVTNYTRKDYDAGTQNWAVAQVPDGTMLFGNHHGLLTFNSRNWNLHGINYGSTVRAICVDTAKRRVYAGGSNEFGYFDNSAPNQRVVYHSLTETLPAADRSFGEIWNIMQKGTHVWLQADRHLLCYDGRRTGAIRFDKKITASAMADKTLYIGFDDGTLASLDTTNPNIQTTNTDTKSRICSLVPLSNGNILIITSLHGIFIYDGIKAASCLDRVSAFIMENQAFCATFGNGLLAIGTVNCGAVICDIDGSNAAYINKSTGLQNNTVLNAAFDASGNLWLCLDNGISCVAASSPIRNLLGNNWDFGAGYASMKQGNKMLLGTNQGLFSTMWPIAPSSTPPAVTKEISGQIWAIDTIAGDLFVSGDLGLYIRNGDSYKLIPDISGATSITASRKYPGYAIAATYAGFYLMKKEGGVWKSSGKINGFSDIPGRPVEDKNGDLWLAHWQKGVYRMSLDIDKRAFNKVRLYNSAHGLPSDRDNTVQKLGDNIIFSTVNGLYNYDRSKDSLVPNEHYSLLFRDMPTSRLYESPTNELWVLGSGRAIVAGTNLVGETHADSTTYLYIGPRLIPGSEHLNFLSKSQLIAGHEEGFFDIDLARKQDSISAKPVYVSALYANQDSLLYCPELFLPEKPVVRVPYSLNSVRFEFVSPDYQSGAEVLYSVCMDGLSDEWSLYSPLSQKEYTDLHEGKYTFRVRAYNRMTGATSECSFGLEVLAPWYRTIWAKALYVILIILALHRIYREYQNKTRQAARKMEMRKNEELAALEMKNKEESMIKDVEIARLKSEQLEQDIRNKSNELSNSTLNLVRKNEILLDISERLTKLGNSLSSQPESAKHSKDISRIKELIRENISHDDDWKTFTRNFDLVYENYMKRLLKEYPMLTVTDQRLCAYIKMGLSSKEIAPLLNITYRSVEMNRYRLRKKMGLSTEISLSDFLRKF